MSFTGSLFGHDGKFKYSSKLKFIEPNTSDELLSEVPKKILKSNSAIYANNKTTSSSRVAEEQIREIAFWRRAGKEDKQGIKQLQVLTGNIANSLYQTPSVADLIEKSLFPIVQTDTKGEIISFTAFDVFPNVPSIPSFFWSDWLISNYRIQGATPRNVLFVHYMLWHPDQAQEFLPLLLEASFIEFLHLKYIIIVKPPNVKYPSFYDEFFIPVLPVGLKNYELESVQTLLVCFRNSIINRLPIRTVFEEEIELVMSIVNSREDNFKKINDQSTELNFFEFVYQSEKKTLVYESGGNISGVMILNLAVDLDGLEQTYELSAFHGLKKRDMDESTISKLSEMEATSKNDNKSFHAASLQFSDQPNLNASSEFLFRKIDIDMDIKKQKKEDPVFFAETNVSSDSDFPSFSVAGLLDDQYKNQTETETQDQKQSVTLKSDGSSEFCEFKMETESSFKEFSNTFVSKYHGHINAFIIDFYAIDCRKLDEKLASFDFLEAAFKAIPDRDYCVMIVPSDVLPTQLCQLFVRAVPQPKTFSNRDLYVCHKNSLSSATMFVKLTEEEDLVDVKNFLKSMDNADRIYHDISNNCFKHSDYFRSFVFLAEGQIIGVSLFDSVDPEIFQKYFNLSEFTEIHLHKGESQSVLKYLIISPIYRVHARFFIRELMRLSNLSCLFYVTGGHDKENFNFITAVDELVPIKPTRKAGLEDPISFRNFTERKYKLPIGLFSISSRLSGIKKLHVNVIIVVVGASRTALAFLEKLIFGPTSTHITYNNLICVTPHPLISEGMPGELNNLLFPFKENFSRKCFSMIPMNTYVSFIYGIMTSINRREKFIVVNNKSIVPYDYLVLTCGLQFFPPVPELRKPKWEAHEKSVSGLISRFLQITYSKKEFKRPKNLFIINTNSDADDTLNGIQEYLTKQNMEDQKIVVYGHNLNVFLALNTLLKLGIPGELIFFIEPPFEHNQKFTLFNDFRVDQAVIETIKNFNISYYSRYILNDWVLSSEGYITSLTFVSKLKKVIVPCLAFIPFFEKLVSKVTYNACKEARLVYDGKLIINHNFLTNDKFIYGAGPFTKYARRYYAEDHQFFNSREIGQKLADIIQRRVTSPNERKTEENFELVPEFKAPILVYCQLPGGFNFLHVRKPGKHLDLETAYNFYDYGEVLSTGDCVNEKGNGYFRLHLSPEGFVETIICYTKNKIDHVNISSLYGLHEKLLNNLLYRYDLSLIPDFFAYFNEPWTRTIFHRHFELLREWNHKVFYLKYFKNDKENFFDKINKVIEDNMGNPVPESVKRELEEEYMKSSLVDEIKNNVMQFLDYFKKDLREYAVPPTVRYMLSRHNQPLIKWANHPNKRSGKPALRNFIKPGIWDLSINTDVQPFIFGCNGRRKIVLSQTL